MGVRRLTVKGDIVTCHHSCLLLTSVYVFHIIRMKSETNTHREINIHLTRQNAGTDLCTRNGHSRAYTHAYTHSRALNHLTSPHSLSISLTDTNIRNYAVLFFLVVLALLSTCAHNGLLPALSIYMYANL